MSATLILVKDGRPVRRFPLGGRTVLGRADDADIQVDEAGVSRRHAAITKLGDAYTLEDLQSRNGTYVNGQPIQKHQLRGGDVIDLATWRLRFHLPQALPFGASGDVTLVQDAVDTTNVLTSAAVSAADLKGSFGEGEVALRRRLEVFFDVAADVSGMLEADELLPRILEALFRVFTQAHRGFIMLIDHETGELVPKAVKKTLEGDGGGITVSNTVINKVIDERQSVLCRDAASDDRFLAAESLVRHSIRSLMCAPLIAGDGIVGVVHIDTTSATPFMEDDLKVLTGIAAQAAMAIRNTQLYEEKVKSERLAMVGQTIAGLSHCVKNILNGITGGGYILEVGLKNEDSGKVAKGWDMVKRNNDFMRDLVLDMLTYAKDREPEYELANANEIVKDVCGLMEERAKQGGIELCQGAAADMKLAAMDRSQIQRCVLNLTTNAIDACVDHGTKVTVSTVLDEGEVRIAIADDGCGMSEENQKKLFQVFFSTKGSQGTGLGLAVSHKIIEEHGGSLDVDSVEGEGTTFTIRLPFMEEPPGAWPTAGGPETDTVIPGQPGEAGA